MRWAHVVFAASVLWLVVSCTTSANESQDPPRFVPLSEIVGAELTANSVVPLPCIPSRADPVGVWVGLRVLNAELKDDTFLVEVEQTDARLGSHPSGCHDPEILLAQSFFLLADDNDTMLATAVSKTVSGTLIEFEVAGRNPANLRLVVLPTIGFEAANGESHTAAFGLVAEYWIVDE